MGLYRRLGLLAEAGETPFVGSLAFFSGRTLDSTVMMLTVSIPNRSLRFAREGDRYRAGYRVGLEVKRGASVVRSVTTDEMVRVLAFRETQRGDESTLFRRTITLAPGTYDVRLTVRGDSVNNGSAIEATVGVPQLGAGTVSSPVGFYEATPRSSRDSLPRLVATPRSTVIFGRDSTFPVYVEGYGDSPEFPVRIEVRNEGFSNVVWTDSASLPRRQNLFAGVVNIPLQRLGVGVMVIRVNRIGGTDTLQTPLFIAFGDDLPVATFAEMLEYLRYYASPARINAMREAPPEQRATLWAEFIRDSDPVPQTPLHEGLRDYFGRIAQANLRFREEGGPGWLTDRGRVFVALGNPDQLLQPNMNDLNQRGRTEVWEYREHRLSLVFVDQTGFGRWRMTLSSEAEFESTVRRVTVQ
ncbi:MAG: GWxTD domain-containing protein [Gemmatimonadaceae bacterium]|nr:GWxTD domain-containing protein [Gemmatimonadaceae bacterium]